MGGVMIALCLWVAVSASPPLGEAVLRTVLPARIDVLAIVTIVGGTVGGYITFAGAHRLLDAGIVGPGAVPAATRAAAAGIGVATLMRILLFLAALGVVASGQALDPANPPASMFRLAAGDLGGRLFGAVMWSAAVTSIVGSAYTSVSFIRTLHHRLAGRSTALLIGFVTLSALVFVAVGNPVTILIAVGALNALILPIGLLVVLLAARRPEVVGAYRHPASLFAAAAVTAVVMAGLGAWTLVTRIPPLFR
jgi:Mn2+/Fe2+ NRAMP family transporter